MGDEKIKATTRLEKIERVERGVKSIERFFIVLGVLVTFLLIGWRMGGDNGGAIVLIGGGLIAVLILIEVLLIEKHKHADRQH